MSLPTLSVSDILKDGDYHSYPLHSCIAIGNLGTLQFLLNKASLDTINESDGKWGAPLHISVYLGNEEAVDMLLKAGACPVRKPDFVLEEYNATPIGVAARLGDMNLLLKLWQHVGFDAAELGGCLIEAAGYGQPSTIGALLDLGRENWPMKTKGLALNRAAGDWKVENIRLLLSRYAFDAGILDTALAQVPPKVWPIRDQTESDLSAQSRVIKLPMTAGADPGTFLRYLSRPLLTHAAVHRHLHVCLEALLDNGADPNASVNAQGQTALHYLAVKGRGQMGHLPKGGLHLPEEPSEAAFRTFFRFNASVLQQDIFGNTPLHFAASTSNLETLQLMLSSLPTDLERKAALMLRNHRGESLLHFASGGAQIDIVEYLLSEEVGLLVDEATSRGWTAFLSALAPVSSNSRSGKIKTAQLLLHHGADPTVVTHDGWTALHCLAIKHGQHEDSELTNFIDTLVSNSVSVDSQARFACDDLDLPWRHDNMRGIPYGCSELRYLEDPEEWGRVVRSDLTPLHVAARAGAIGTTRALLRHGADPTAVDSEGNSPAKLAGDLKYHRFVYPAEDQDRMISLIMEAGGSY
ncbi:ankyrin repeat [Fusarium sporotrichioides]|uniref:Ankyrin repeat n=1 Tax=Fusarium sporotrichioides TaxID=5514 RepID=A0A395SGA2_FUSSP|nr:ankyrin repeat [Fusarium sporotrichioides]